MSYSSMREFLDQLEKEGKLIRVKEPVDTHLEMTEIQTRLLAEVARLSFLNNQSCLMEASATCRWWSIFMARLNVWPWV